MKTKQKFKKLLAVFLCLVTIAPIFSGLSIVAKASEITPKFTYQYRSNGTWKTFNGRINGTAEIDGIRIRNNGTNAYYLQYRTQNAGVSGYYSYVKSTDTDSSSYAGSAGKPIQKLQLQAYNSSGTKLVNELVLMWRVKTANSGWLDWVSNAGPEYMRTVQSDYNLDGNIDTASAYAGKGTENVIGIEIRVFSDIVASDTTTSVEFDGVEVTPTLSFMVDYESNWHTFDKGVFVAAGIDGIKIQTPSNKSYSLSYKTMSETKNYYYPAVSSTGSDYAGLPGEKIQRLNIKVLNSNGTSLTSGVVVMYRAYVDRDWLPWVSNADPEYMKSVYNKFGLDGTLDTAGGYAGKTGEIIKGIQIRVFEGTIPSSTIENLPGREVRPTMSYMVNSSSNWNSFTSKVETAMDGIKIQTDPSKPYYLNYRTMNSPNTSYYPYVTSEENDYAGSPGKRMTRLGIQVLRKSDNAKIDSGVVVMYRVKVDNNWLPWVSNAGPEWMRSVQVKYGITGVLDTASGYAGKSDGSPIQGVEIRVFEENGLTTKVTNTGQKKVLTVPYIDQTVKYKTGCESVSTVMVLNYFNCNISPETFIDNYLAKGSYDSFDPNVCFGGNPYTTNGMGCYAPVITKAVNQYASKTGAKVSATSLTGKTLEYLCSQYIDKHIPVVLWATIDMKTPYNGRKIPYGDSYIQWIAPEHCLVLVGYDDNNYIFNDPMRQAKIYYGKDIVTRAYLGLGAQAVVITSTNGSTPTGSTSSAPTQNPTASATEKKPDNTVDKSHAADPINLFTGAHEIKNDILTLFGGQNLSVTAHYDSSKLVKGAMGVGWYHNYEKSLIQSDSGIFVFDSPSTYCVYDNEDNANLYTCTTMGRTGYEITIDQEDSNYRYILDCNGERTEYYNSDGLLTKVVDRNGFVTLISHTDTVMTITDTVTGKHVYIEYSDDGKVTRIYDDAQREVTFTYLNDYLINICDANGSNLTYSYNDEGRVATGTDKEDVCYFENTYDELGRVISQVDGAGSDPTLISYGENNSRVITDRNGCQSTRVFNSAGLLIRYTDENGNTSTYEYDANCNLVKETDALGNDVSAVYNSFNKPTQITDKNGNTVYYTYDANGNLTKATYPQNGVADVEETYTYNSRNQVVRYIDLRGTATVFTYDANGLLTSKKVGNRDAIQYAYTNGYLTTETDAENHAKQYTYNAFGLPVTMTDAANHQTTYEYDLCGNLLVTTDANGKSIVNTFDANYNQTSVTDANGNQTWYSYNGNMKPNTVTMPDGTTVSYEYDGEDRVVKTKDQNGNITTTEYDDAGRVISVQDVNKNTTYYEYDAAGNVIKEISKSGAETSKTYDATGNVLTVTDDNGNVTAYEYDEMSRVVKVTDALAGITTYQYNNAGDLLKTTDAMGNFVVYTYDAYGNKLTETDARGNTTTYTYDDNGNLLTVKDALNHVTTYTYDSRNLLVSVTDAKNQTITYGYDALGRQTSVTDAKGNTVYTAYDANGNVITVTDAKGNVVSEATYNELNLAEMITDASGSVTTYQYNNIGKPEIITDSLGNRQQYWYDKSGNNIKVMDASDHVSTATYNALGNVTSLTGPLNGTTAYTYDELGRLVSETTASGGTINYGYNALHLRTQLTNARGQARNYTYDALGRITGYTSAEGSASYTYDANGNVLTATDQNGTVTREYDALNRVTRYVDTLGNVIQYEYDAVGNLARMIYPDNTAVTYAYDANNNLVSVTDWANRVTSYSYDVNNNLVGVTKPDGSVTTTVYDNANRVTSTVERNSADEVIVGYEYTYDALGRVLSETHLAQNVKYEYTYDVLSRVTKRKLTNLTDNTTSEETYAYDAAGNITSCTVSNADSTFVYDANNRLTSYNGHTITYDADGNMVSGFFNDAEMAFAYDSANRLLSAGGNSYIYNVEDVRVRNLCDESETTYAYNTNGRLSQLLVKTTDGVVTKYVYGLGLIGEESGGNFKTYHFDYRGSTVAITDQNGSVTDTFVYDTYGSLLSRTGTTSVIFLYNGRDGVVTDSNGLIYMRARYYSPELRRFINADIVAGEISNAATLNRYAYANGNPVSNIDPFGLSAERGNLYDRDAVAKYASKYYKNYNSEYAPFDKAWFIVYYLLNYGTLVGGDCANFVSQCMAAGGLEQNEDWYFEHYDNELVTGSLQLYDPFVTYYYDKDGQLTTRKEEYSFSGAWALASEQYKYFSNPKNGYINGEVIKIDSYKDIKSVIKNYNIQKGDLLYWSEDGGNSAYHATIINKVSQTDILFAGHTSSAYDKKLSTTMKDNGKSVMIIRMKDYI